MGGRNQNTQLSRSRWTDAPDVLAESSREALDATRPTDLPAKPPSFADFSAPGVLTAAPKDDSKGFPVALGVFAEPKEAKAPDPRPKAFDAPPVGDAKPPPGVVMELKGLVFWSEELSPPIRLKELLRPEGLSP